MITLYMDNKKEAGLFNPRYRIHPAEDLAFDTLDPMDKKLAKCLIGHVSVHKVSIARLARSGNAEFTNNRK